LLIYRKKLCGVHVFTQILLRYNSDISFFMGKILVSRVAELRKCLDLTQRELANLVGVTETTIRNWENSRSGVEWFEKIAKLCNALECTPNDLFGYKKIGEEEGKDG
jgi:putative transcriptional regulator